jgi:hypothetical protein
MYYRFKAKPSWQIIDGKMVYLDSAMEAIIIQRLLLAGFSKKWRRTRLVQWLLLAQEKSAEWPIVLLNDFHA